MDMEPFASQIVFLLTMVAPAVLTISAITSKHTV